MNHNSITEFIINHTLEFNQYRVLILIYLFNKIVINENSLYLDHFYLYYFSVKL